MQSLSEQQRPPTTRVAKGKLSRTGEAPYSLISHLKLYVSERTDDEGIAFVVQTLLCGPQLCESITIKYRVKYGKNKQDLTRSVKHKNDDLLSNVIAKL